MTTFYARVEDPEGTAVFTEESGWSSDAAKLHGFVMGHPDRQHVRDLVFTLDVVGSEVDRVLEGYDGLDPSAVYRVEVDEY